jgi:hypothetical protein
MTPTGGVHLSAAGERRAARRLGWAGLGRLGRAGKKKYWAKIGPIT